MQKYEKKYQRILERVRINLDFPTVENQRYKKNIVFIFEWNKNLEED